MKLLQNTRGQKKSCERKIKTIKRTKSYQRVAEKKIRKSRGNKTRTKIKDAGQMQQGSQEGGWCKEKEALKERKENKVG